MSIEAMKQALEALETLNSGDSYKTHNAATALRQAIREAEKEQVDFQDFVANVQEAERQACEIINREWVGLTDEDREEARELAARSFRRHKYSIRGQQVTEADSYEWHYAHTIEAKLKEKNHVD